MNKQLLALLGISETCYVETVEQLGYDYAWHYTLHNEANVKLLTQCKGYWDWFKSQLQVKNQVFESLYRCYQHTNSEAFLFDMWLDTQSPAHVLGQPGKVVLHQINQLLTQNNSHEQENVTTK